jgi:hypothetical protein
MERSVEPSFPLGELVLNLVGVCANFTSDAIRRWYLACVYFIIIITMQCNALTIPPLFLIYSSKGTMKISLAFGLAQQPIAMLSIKFGTVSKRSCSYRRTQTWNTRRTRTPCKTSRPFETHKSGSQSQWTAGLLNTGDLLNTGGLRNTGHPRLRRRSKPIPPLVARVLGANEKPSPRVGIRDAGVK